MSLYSLGILAIDIEKSKEGNKEKNRGKSNLLDKNEVVKFSSRSLCEFIDWDYQFSLVIGCPFSNPSNF